MNAFTRARHNLLLLLLQPEGKGLYLEAGVTAVTGEVVDTVDASPHIHAGRRLAVVDVDLAIGAAKAGCTHARVRGHAVDASRAVHAGIALALVHVDLAGLTGVAGRALALERIDAIDARGVVLARAAQALVDVDVAMVPGEAGPAEAFVAALGVDADTVAARLHVAVRLALVHVELAVLACKDRSSIERRCLLRSGVNSPFWQFTVEYSKCVQPHTKMVKLALKARMAVALEAALAEVDACAILARFRGAVVNDQGAVGVSVTVSAFALVTGDAVHADFVVGARHAYAVVNVHVACLEVELHRHMCKYRRRISRSARASCALLLLLLAVVNLGTLV